MLVDRASPSLATDSMMESDPLRMCQPLEVLRKGKPSRGEEFVENVNACLREFSTN